MSIHQIEITKNCNGTVEIGEAFINAEIGYAKAEGKLKQYVFDLSDHLGDNLKFSLYKNPKGEWFDIFLFPNPYGQSDLIKLVKEKVDQLGI